MSASSDSPSGRIRPPTGDLGKKNAFAGPNGPRSVGTAQALLISEATRARAVAAMLAIALGYFTARVSGSPSSTSYAMLLLAALVLTILAFIYGLRPVLLAAAILGVPFQFDKNFFYDYELSAHGAIGGISVSITTIALIGLYALWAADLLLASHRTSRPRLRWALVPFAYVSFAAASILVANSLGLALNELSLLAQCLLLFLYVSSTVESAGQLRRLIFLLLLALTLQASLLLIQYYTGASIQFAGLSSRERIEETTRVAGTLGSPNSAGGFLASCIAIAVALLVARGFRSSRILPLAGISIGVLALVVTFSRGGWLAAATATTLLLVFFVVRGQLTKKILIVGAVIAVLGLFMGGQIQARLQSQTGGLQPRADVAGLALHVIRDHPLSGVGVNNYVTVLPDYEPLIQWAFVPHNKFLIVWSETGLGGLLTFMLFLLTAARWGWLALRKASDSLLPYAAALTAAFIALFVQMNFEPFHGRLDLMFFFLLAALLRASAHLAEQEARLREPDLNMHEAG